jgi:hypothetical protein
MRRTKVRESYVPDYLNYAPRQMDGWPERVDDPSKMWAERVVRKLLDDGAVSLEDVRAELFSRSDSPFESTLGELEFQRFCALRALLACDAREVWVRRKYRRY